MKNSLDFNFHSANYLEAPNFIQRFTSAYIFLETSINTAILNDYDSNKWNGCVNCGSGGKNHSCKKDNAAAKRCTYFALFNTMCGNSALRRRFDGTPTEMQKLTGEYDNGCGSDFTVDFLFGYTGYEYRKCTDSTTFKDEIITSINTGKPVIVKTKSGDFQLITGYDCDTLIIPPHVYYDFSTKPPSERWEVAPSYNCLEVLYIFGDKTGRRYTLKDGLKNIRRVMEYNINEGLWDEYLIKLGGWGKFPSDDGLDKADPDEKKARANNLAKTNMYMYNNCSTNSAFGAEKIPGHCLEIELSDPAISDLWGKTMDESIDTVIKAGHKTGTLNREKIWLIDDPSKISALSMEICDELTKAKEADIKLLEIINQAIEILDSPAA